MPSTLGMQTDVYARMSVMNAGATPAERIAELDDIDTLVRVYRPRLLRFVMFSAGDQDVAESITQDCFLKAYTARRQFRGDCSPYTWLATIAINLIKDHQRSARLRFWRQTASTGIDISELASLLPSGAASQERQLLGQERAAQMARILDTLSPLQKRVFLLRFIEEMDAEEICLATGLTLATMKTHLHRAVKAVRLKMGATQ